ncbi:MAG: hypothetical protein HQK53_18470 [Oligoflexia bacterium]|nr:hypothetical protein [Oligoflexia bacterium]
MNKLTSQSSISGQKLLIEEFVPIADIADKLSVIIEQKSYKFAINFLVTEYAYGIQLTKIETSTIE